MPPPAIASKDEEREKGPDEKTHLWIISVRLAALSGQPSQSGSLCYNRGFAPLVPVSSRGQDRWFSATDRGSNPRTGTTKVGRGTVPANSDPTENFSFKVIRSAHWREAERSDEHFPQKLPTRLDIGGQERLPVIVRACSGSPAHSSASSATEKYGDAR